MNRALLIFAITLAALVATPAEAKVDAVADNGFALSFELDISASPAQLWATLVQPKSWWSGAHSWSGDAANFWMTPVPGGCFCETLPAGKDRKRAGFTEHARILYAKPGEQLRMSGGFGPLQGEAVTGTLTYAITPAANGASKLKVDYVVGGYSRILLKAVAPAVDKVLGEQMTRLKAAAEKPRR